MDEFLDDHDDDQQSIHYIDGLLHDVQRPNIVEFFVFHDFDFDFVHRQRTDFHHSRQCEFDASDEQYHSLTIHDPVHQKQFDQLRGTGTDRSRRGGLHQQHHPGIRADHLEHRSSVHLVTPVPVESQHGSPE
jgi:hypothetical protein